MALGGREISVVIKIAPFSLCFHDNNTSRTIEHLPHNCLFVQSSGSQAVYVCVRQGGASGGGEK